MRKFVTDAAVAALDLREGRAELLEEIMSTPVADRTPSADTADPTAGHHRRRWLPAVAAAAAVAVIVGALAALRLFDDGPQVVTEPPFAAPARGTLAVLDQPGWELRSATVQPSYGSLSYEKGKAAVEIRWKAADLHDEYVADRTRIDAPAVDPGEPLTLLGAPALLWAYAPDDHTVIRRADGDVFLEVRGSGLAEAAYRTLLTRLVAIAPGELDDHLPARFVTGPERADAVQQALAGIPLPDGLDAGDIESSESDPYHLGADVTGTVVCAWIDQYVAARADGDAGAAQEAQDALATSPKWPVLRRMNPEGDYPEVVWEFSADIGKGTVPEQYQQGLGCD